MSLDLGTSFRFFFLGLVPPTAAPVVGLSPDLSYFHWPLPPSRALSTVTRCFSAMSTFVQTLVALSGQ